MSLSTAPSLQEEIQLRLQHAFSPCSVEVFDDSAAHKGHAGAKNGGGHFQVILASGVFNQTPLMQQHRMVYAVLQDLIPHKIHALQLKTQALPPEQF